MKQHLTLSIVGSGGDGAVAAGDILSMTCAREGLNIIKTEAYGPQIRGGESSCTVRISSAPIFAQADFLDALVVFSWADFARFRTELVLGDDAVVLHDSDDPVPDEIASSRGLNVVSIPFTKLAREVGAPNGKNILSLGVVSAVFGLPADALRSAIESRFKKKTAAVIEANLKAFDAGVAAGDALAIGDHRLQYNRSTPKLMMAGNEASAVAAIDAGCRFFAGYPITPSSEILHFMAEWLPKLGGTCLQTEDELAAMGAVVGGSFAGVKSMTATSGPGLSLMSEMMGLASMAEVPAVIVNVQRGGPSTGLPTKSEQSDLMHAVYGGHGDMPRVVIAPVDVEDSYHATVEAFNIAEEFQLPVIVLTDQSIAQRRETLAADSLTHEVVERRLATPDELKEYKRYRITPDGVSPMSVPGMVGGMYQTNGLEHDEYGRPSSMFVMHEEMNAKRYRKLDGVARKYRSFRRYGPEKADLGMICYGSSMGPVREAIERLNAEGLRVAGFVPRLIMPLPVHDVEKFLADCENILVAELSYSAQLYHYLRTQVDLPRGKTRVFARSGGRSLGVNEVIEQAKRTLVGVQEVQEVLA
jgi:2-oxoglutarate/2-oxoacid ferredoxin oxidoreductase subunit alpha